MAISPIISRSPMRWSKAVSWHHAFSTCSSPVSSTMPVQGLNEGVYIHYHFHGLHIQSFPTHSQVKDTYWSHPGSSCLLITVNSWHTSSVTCKPYWTGSQYASKLFDLTICLGKTEVLFQPASNSSDPSANHHHLMTWSWRLSRASSTL